MNAMPVERDRNIDKRLQDVNNSCRISALVIGEDPSQKEETVCVTMSTPSDYPRPANWSIVIVT